ncbi:MAG: hypothetical protein IIA35_02595, partial [Proteobacteria bacterium]|nr:hypothetical protein [Pseudomonadota bacterium]
MNGEPIHAILDRLDGVRSVGRDKWVALCPAHDDRNRVGGQIETPSGYAIFPGMVQTRERLAEDCNLVH